MCNGYYNPVIISEIQWDFLKKIEPKKPEILMTGLVTLEEAFRMQHEYMDRQRDIERKHREDEAERK